MSLLFAAQSGDRLQTLQVLRDTLAAAIEDTNSGRDIAALSRQLTDVLAQIAEFAVPEKEGTALDELEKRRAAREANAKGRTGS